GTFKKTAGGGTTTIGVTFDNPGTVEVDSGTLSLTGAVTQVSGNTLTGGVWNVLNSSTLNLSGANITNNQGALTLGGAPLSFAAINGLGQNNGSFTLVNGAHFTTTGALRNPGTLTLGANTVPNV